MITAVLKTLKDIETSTTLEVSEEHGKVRHTDGVWYKKEILKELRGMSVVVVKDINVYSDMFAVGVIKPNGKTTYISPAWIKEITYKDEVTGTEISAEYPKSLAPSVESTYVSLTPKRLLDTAKMVIVDAEKVPMCSCGTMIDANPKLLKLGLCSKCVNTKFFNVESYKYKPTPNFTGKQLKADEATPTWYGIELEYGYHQTLPVSLYCSDYNVYLKSDGSIKHGNAGGVEVVTHPHSFSALMKKGSLVDGIATIDANESDNNGCHIHMGRTAWKDDTHYALMYYLMYELGKAGALESIGGRDFTRYCTFDRPLEKIHRKAKDKVSGDRTIWANETNSSTVEFRFFKGTNDPKTLKRYIQLLESVLKYTKYHSKTVSINGWLDYIKSHNTKYPELLEFVTGIAIIDKIVTFREPIKENSTFEELKFGNLHDIVSLVTTTGVEYKDITRVVVENDRLYMYKEGQSAGDVRFSFIKSVTLEV